jgi:hypothetical protein
MLSLTDEQWLQIVLIVGPFLSLIGTWLSLRTYTQFSARKKENEANLSVLSQSETPEEMGKRDKL